MTAACTGMPKVAGGGECFEHRLGNCAPVVFDDHENGHQSTPSSSSRSTTAGAASGPVPRMTVSLATSGGLTRRTCACPPAGASTRSY